MQANANDIPLQIGDYRSKRRQSVLLGGDERHMVAGESCFRKAGVERNVVNPGPGTVEFVETELLE